MQFPYLILTAIIASLAVMQINHRVASPMLSILDRWLRWLVFAFGGAQICIGFKLIDRPYWVLVLVLIIVWFLGETMLNWLRIHALSVSPMPLFPRYEVNEDGDEWPIQPRLLKLREWLRGQGFKQVQALKAEIGPGIYLRVSMYQSTDAHTRVQVTFIPQASGAITVCLAAMSMTTDGERYITDNLYVPFAGFYPAHWFVERTPWRRSLRRLLARHHVRLGQAKATLEPWTVDPLTDVNASQQELDRVNTELGFLHHPPERDDLGKITHEGRYRVWKEIWMLNYLGRAMRYE
ncbi:hypothetical protein [Opitutus terrae]|uniref:Uncharacterized protein n=1 Tax=Opitutus terrae (strain DSM 11246 / JCM 15787 / PB90-1) TaxID=452637 RepID=B1ZXL8_OPITP|nr:hypothetical protein [Opitutus terrae]ACB74240.1 hypothetical protein Oter_0952 [Opitutus terrae PB90-1]